MSKCSGMAVRSCRARPLCAPARPQPAVPGSSACRRWERRPSLIASCAGSRRLGPPMGPSMAAAQLLLLLVAVAEGNSRAGCCVEVSRMQ